MTASASPPNTTDAPIGYYVHHHGSGHEVRFGRISAAAGSPYVPISERAFVGGVLLPSDVPEEEAIDPTADGTLHWAPLGAPGSATRASVLVDWIAANRPPGIVVDVSVEAALLCRLAGVRTVVVRQHGERDDAAHRLAYRTAQRLLAPFPAALEHPRTPAWVVGKTSYAGFIAPRDPALGVPSPVAGEALPGCDDIVVLWGSGGGQLSDQAFRALVGAADGAHVWVLGDAHPVGGSFETSDDVTLLGRVDEPVAWLAHAPTVVASAGNNAVSEAATSGCALVVVPQDRPFREQHRHAESLDAAGVASVITMTPTVDDWRSALHLARRRRSALTGSCTPDGAARAATVVDEAFASSSRH